MVRFLRIAGYVSVSASVLCGIPLFAIRWLLEREESPPLLELLFVLLLLALLTIALAGGLLGAIALVRLFLSERADRRTLLWSIGAFALPVLLSIAFVGTMTPGLPEKRHAEFTAVAERAQALIAAIERYELDHARPPYALAALVPGYLHGVPRTGHPRYPDFEYDFFDPGDGRLRLVWYEARVTEERAIPLERCGPRHGALLLFVVEDDERIVAVQADRPRRGSALEPFDPERWSLHPEQRGSMIESLLSATDFDGMELDAARLLLGQWDGIVSFCPPPAGGVRWELSVPCSLGFANWDRFFYWPTEDYPPNTGAGSIERLGRWAYLHE